MRVTDFTSNDEINIIMEKARAIKESGKRFSDVQDEQGNQYVDLVQEGGGVLGVALLGYTYVLENIGIRFFNLAGTSAGAIISMFFASFGQISEAKSEKILAVFASKSFFDFVDGGKASQAVIKKVLSGTGGLGWTLLLYGIPLLRQVRSKLGLNPGDDFERWLQKALSDVGVNNLQDLQNLRKKLPSGLHYVQDGSEIKDVVPRIAVIVTDVTTQTKVTLPDMAKLYWKNPQATSPAAFVRASMSVPLFFEPYEVSDLPNAGQREDKNWIDTARYSGEVPNSVKFVDGGVLSNFPINTFHRRDGKTPKMPTFGARLSAYRLNYTETADVLSFGGGIFNSMKQVNDLDFLLKNPDYRQLVCRIKADQQFNWLNFFMEDEKKIALFNLGAQKALEFLQRFDWEAYKKSRA